MILQPRFIAFLLALFIASITAAFSSLIPGTPSETVFITFLVALTSTFLLTYFTLEFLIFRELTKVNSLFDKIKKKEFNIRKSDFSSHLNPIKNLNIEIAGFAALKQKEIDELKKIESYRREFIADLSHELKTPIFAAQGFIHTLLDGAMTDPEVSEKFLKKAAKSLDGLDELVQDLLTLSEIETGSVKMKKETFDIYPMVTDVFDQLEKKALRRNISLKVERNVEKPMLAHADPKRIFQVLVNLVENGIKYGLEGGFVKVGISQEKDHLEITVADNGPGILEEDQKRIFERFYRVEKSRSKEKGGSGLGLAIANQIVEAHKSKIHLNSKPGKGCKFSFKLSMKQKEVTPEK